MQVKSDPLIMKHTLIAALDHIFHTRQIVSVSLRVLPSDSPLCVINSQQT